MSRLLSASALCAAAALVCAPAEAAVIATLTFDTPSATIFSNEAVPVWVTLHLSADSDPIVTDPFTAVTSGVTTQQIIDAGIDPDTVTRINTNNSFECSGTFTNGCDPGAYAFDFNFDPPSFVGAANLDLEPGSDTSFLFGTFTPVGGNAAPGFYTFYNANFIFQVSYTNPDYDPDDPDSQPTLVHDFNIASTCAFPNQGPACAFTREVLAAPGGGAVPEPSGWALMIAGFGGAGAMLRRRRAAAAV
jgi:hypothetical protein